MIDDVNRQSVLSAVATAIDSARLVRFFAHITRDHGLPTIIRSDNGPEFRGEAFKQWSTDNDTALQHIEPSKPTQNALIGPVNRTFRADVRVQHLFFKP